MKVALVSPIFHPHIGGQETRFRAFATELTKRGHEVTVLTVGHHTTLASTEVLDGFVIKRWPLVDLDGYPVKRLGSVTVGRIERVLRIRFPYLRQVWRELRSGGYSAIYMNQNTLIHALAVPRRMRRMAGIDWCEIKRDVPHRLAQRFLPRTVGFNLCVQPDFAEVLSAASGAKVEYLPSGVYPARYRHDPSATRTGWVFVGRWMPNKRLGLLIQAWEEFRSTMPDEPLILIGDGPERPAIEAAIAAVDPSIRQDIRVVGHVDEAEKIDHLAKARLMVLTSDIEGFPNVVTEAMASALPVVTVDSELNGTAAVVRQNGIGLVASADPRSIAETAAAVYNDWETFSDAALAASRTYDWDLIVDRLLVKLQHPHPVMR